MIDVKIIGMSKLKYVQQNIDKWVKKYPALTRQALEEGTTRVRDRVVEKMKSQLTRRSGELFGSVKKKVSVTPGAVSGRVYIDDPVQGIKARAHELGAYRSHPGGDPYIIDRGSGRVIILSKNHPLAGTLPKTKPSHSRLPRRPSFKPALRAEQKNVVNIILRRIVGGLHGYT